MYIHRHIESVVVRIAKRKPVIVLTGASQVGKSTMLREVYHDINYITLNRPLVRQSAKDYLITLRTSLMKIKQKGSSTSPVLRA